MQIVIIGIIALAVLGLVAALFSRGDKSAVVRGKGDCTTCEGSDPKCEQVCMMEASVKEIEYFDDEHLDRFKGRDASGYSDDEVEEFRDVLYTMNPNGCDAWSRSLVLRGVNVPNQLKDELFMMIEG